MTTDVFRFEYWPDFSFDDPDLIRIANQTFQWQLATIENAPSLTYVWGFYPDETSGQKFEKFMDRSKSAYKTVMQHRTLEWFSYKMYKNDSLVAIYTGYLTTTSKGKIFNVVTPFVGEAYAEGIGPLKELIEFMSQFDIISHKDYLPVGHPKIKWLKQTYGVEPTSIEHRPIGPNGMPAPTGVYSLFDQLNKVLSSSSIICPVS